MAADGATGAAAAIAPMLTGGRVRQNYVGNGPETAGIVQGEDTMAAINEVVGLHHVDGVAVIAMDSPPVNALGHKLREGLMQALAAAGEAKLVILQGTERAFSGGADITEFGHPALAPSLRDVIAAIEAMPVPVIAAIRGVALGGGLELALGCHGRVVWEGARLGVPEVKLGLLPGAGGTQRLPRLLGVEQALPMIVTGTPVSAAEAARIGLADALLEGPCPEAAIDWARHATGLMRVRDRVEAIAPAVADPGLIDRVAAPLLKGLGAAAPRTCVEAVRGAVTMAFDAGLAQERRLFEQLMAGDESRAQRHAFFAEREAQKAVLPAGTVPRPVRSAVVIGAGTMGGGIAMCFANAGIPVTIIELEQGALDRGMARVHGLYDTSLKRGSITTAEAVARRGRITGQTGLDTLPACDIVIEAVFEDMEVKQDVFRQLDRLARPGCILASNTSYLDIDEIAASTGRPQDVLGMHFFSPANVMRLLEIVRGSATAPDVIATASALGKAMGKVAVTVGNCFGFVGNRILARRTEAAERLLLDGASPNEVDAALVRFGFRMGPFAMADLAGLDIGMRIRRAFNKRAPVADALCEAGRFGQKAGRGYYLYEGRVATPDPAVDAIIAGESAKLGIARRAIPEAEIIERLVYPMVNEAARILDEGIAARPGDVDTIWLHGYNWPAYRGGPTFYADLVGARHIEERLTAFAAESGDETLRPAPMLARMAAAGQGFHSRGVDGAKQAR